MLVTIASGKGPLVTEKVAGGGVITGLGNGRWPVVEFKDVNAVCVTTAVAAKVGIGVLM